MSRTDDPRKTLFVEEGCDEFDGLRRRPVSPVPSVTARPSAATARFHGFDVDERVLVVGLPDRPHEIVSARTTVPLSRSQIGCSVVLLFEDGDLRRPIVVGVLQEQRPADDAGAVPPQFVSVRADDDRFVISAEREIVLRCGDASITLTRAGKILIRGRYIVSRSTGYNRIKGAAVEIN
jgi:hypothetical protein